MTGPVEEGSGTPTPGTPAHVTPAPRLRWLRGARLPVGRPRTRWTVAAVLLVAALIPAADPGNYALRIMATVGVYAMLATGLNIVVGRAGLLDLGYVAFFGLGAYSYAIVNSNQAGLHLGFLVGLAIAIGIAALSGLLLGLPVLRLRGDYLAIVTLGFGEIVYLVLLNLDRPINITNGVSGILDLDPVNILGLQFESVAALYYLILVFLVVSVLVAHRLVASRIGRAWVAIREDEDAARAAGINAVTAKLWAFMIGASFSGVAGTLFASLQGAIFPNTFLFTQSITVLAMVVLGGMGTLWGPLVGAGAMVILPEMLRDFGAARFVLVGVVFVVLMLFRPHGLLGARRPERSLRRTIAVGAPPPDEAVAPGTPGGSAAREGAA